VVVMFELYRQQKFIFAPYEPPAPPPNSFKPLGVVRQLSPEEQKKRADAINNALTSTGTS